MNIKSNKKYLLLIPLVVSMIMVTFFSAAYNEIIRQKHEQKYHSMKVSLDIIASQIDRFVSEDNDWGEYDYVGLINPMIEEMDAQPMVYGELFDHNLVSLSNRVIDDNEGQIPFDPRDYADFLSALDGTEDSGELICQFDDGLHAPYEMNVYYRKIPSGEYANKCVAVIGIGKYAIDDNFAPWLIWGVVGLVSMTLVLQIAMILYISKLADTERATRKGTKKDVDGEQSAQKAGDAG